MVYAADHGATAIYAEKAMAASMEEADRLVESVEHNGVIFNLGTNRRWDPAFDMMKSVIDSGDLGRLSSISIYNTGERFNGASHHFDIAMRLNNDQPVLWVQAHLPYGHCGEHANDGDFEYLTFPDYERVSPTLRLVQALDTGKPTRGGVRLARRNLELIFAFIESHRRGGKRVRLPLDGCKLTLQCGVAPKPPRYSAE